MGDDYERRIAVLETHIPYIRESQQSLSEKMESFHAESKQTRQATLDKLDALTAMVNARENQAKGAAWVANLFIGALGMLGGVVGYIIAKIFPVIGRLG